MSKDAIRCDACGKYMSFKDIQEGHTEYTPLNEFGPEEIKFVHRKCEGNKCG